MNTRDSAKAFDALMQETPYSHFDSGCEGIIIVLFVAPIIGGIIGAFIARGLFKKHFVKAGIV